MGAQRPLCSLGSAAVHPGAPGSRWATPSDRCWSPGTEPGPPNHEPGSSGCSLRLPTTTRKHCMTSCSRTPRSGSTTCKSRALHLISSDPTSIPPHDLAPRKEALCSTTLTCRVVSSSFFPQPVVSSLPSTSSTDANGNPHTQCVCTRVPDTRSCCRHSYRPIGPSACMPEISQRESWIAD